VEWRASQFDYQRNVVSNYERSLGPQLLEQESSKPNRASTPQISSRSKIRLSRRGIFLLRPSKLESPRLNAGTTGEKPFTRGAVTCANAVLGRCSVSLILCGKLEPTVRRRAGTVPNVDHWTASLPHSGAFRAQFAVKNTGAALKSRYPQRRGYKFESSAFRLQLGADQAATTDQDVNGMSFTVNGLPKILRFRCLAAKLRTRNVYDLY
jgi:hypothetical protein